MKKLILAAVLALPVTAQAQQPPVLKPWANENTIRHLYVLAGQPRTFRSGGQEAMGYPVLKYAVTKGTVEWIGGRIFRWKTVNGLSEIYHAGPFDQGMISDNPLPIFVCESGPCAGWSFVRPPFAGVQVTPPPPSQPPPVPAPPAPPPPPAPLPIPAKPPEVLETHNYYRLPSPQAYSIYRRK